MLKMVQYIVQEIVRGGDDMLAVNYSTIRSKLKDYCDQATDNNETVIVTRKDEKNVVIRIVFNGFACNGRI